ncbi:MAG: protein-methionine-sulfoxide reductase heme-binding subunit MsrQ [Pseudomonadota bacterium]
MFRWLVKPLVFLLCLVPAYGLVVDILANNLGANPIENLTHRTGDWTLRLLLVTLAITPLRRLSGWTWPLRLRRMLGLFAFFYALCHFSIYFWLDQQLVWPDIVEDVIERPYITVGFTAFLLLIPLAVTSTRGMMRRLGKRWKQLHQLVYVAAALGILHFLWLVKADSFEPLIYAGVLAMLLICRRWPRRRKDFEL